MDELKKYGDNIVINDYEISVLSKCNINVTKCKTIAEILLLIDRYLDDADLEDEEYEEIDNYVYTVETTAKSWEGAAKDK